MSAKRTTKPSHRNEKPRRGRASLGRLRKATERGIRRSSPPELSDLPAGFFADAVLVHPTPKQPISLRVDADVLEWFRAQGPRYQSRMNAVLRAYMAAVEKGAARQAEFLTPWLSAPARGLPCAHGRQLSRSPRPQRGARA